MCRFVNCTLSGNYAGEKGGISILFIENSDMLEFENCILWGNSAALGGNDIRINSLVLRVPIIRFSTHFSLLELSLGPII